MDHGIDDNKEITIGCLYSQNMLVANKDVGSISNLGGARHFKGTFSIRKRGHFLKMKRAILCLLQKS